MTSQYETNLWSTHVNIVRLAEPIRRCVRWRTQVFKIEGFVCKRFLPSPPPPPSFTFWLSFHFSRGQNRSPLPRYFFTPKPNGNACYAGYALRGELTSLHRLLQDIFVDVFLSLPRFNISLINCFPIILFRLSETNFAGNKVLMRWMFLYPSLFFWRT